MNKKELKETENTIEDGQKILDEKLSELSCQLTALSESAISLTDATVRLTGQAEEEETEKDANKQQSNFSDRLDNKIEDLKEIRLKIDHSIEKINEFI